MYDARIERIQQKLQAAKAGDPGLEVFGAGRHKYTIGRPVSEAQVRAFEERYGVELPGDYKAFLTRVGNGGIKYPDSAVSDSAAGPFFGIYALGDNVGEASGDGEKYLSAEALLYPGMTDAYWKELHAKIEADDDMPDAEYEAEIGRIYGGILPIGSQGCTYLHGLVLNGPHKGRVVNLDSDDQVKPQFAFETDFLTWYERWLDEVIAGELQNSRSWFGYLMGGMPDVLFKTYLEATDPETQQEALTGLLDKKQIDDSGLLRQIETEAHTRTGDVRILLTGVLCKFDHARAKPFLVELGSVDLLGLYQFIIWYAKDRSGEWIPYAIENMHRVNDAKTLDFCRYMFEEAKKDITKWIVPLADSPDAGLRTEVYRLLGNSSRPMEHFAVFAKGLEKESGDALTGVLNALEYETDSRLPEAYRQLLERLPKEEKETRNILKTRLEELKNTPPGKGRFRFWK